VPGDEVADGIKDWNAKRVSMMNLSLRSFRVLPVRHDKHGVTPFQDFKVTVQPNVIR
jgi:hypothetical protein